MTQTQKWAKFIKIHDFATEISKLFREHCPEPYAPLPTLYPIGVPALRASRASFDPSIVSLCPGMECVGNLS